MRIVVGLVCATLALAAWPSPPARAAACPEANPTPTSNCGPEFTLPQWGDAAGWTEPSQYTTIQLADVNGDGKDELIGRSDAGLEIWEFDTTVGQWRPQVDAKDTPQVLTDFRSPLPSEAGASWNRPEYYETIQTANVDAKPGEEILARFPDGMRVYKYTPPAGTNKIDGGSWSVLSTKGPFSDADGYTDPSLYLSIRTDSGLGTVDQPPRLIAQSKAGMVVYFWNGSGWILAGSQINEPYSDAPANYENFKAPKLATPTGVVPGVAFSDAGGVATYYKVNQGVGWHWERAGGLPNPGWFNQKVPCTTECFDSSPSYYETLRFANVDGKPGDEMLGRLSPGLQLFKLSDDGKTWKYLTTLTDLGGAAHGPNPPPAGRWASIRTANIDGKGGDEVLALDGNGLQAWSYSATGNSWTKLNPTTPLALSSDPWDTKLENSSTIQTGDVNGDGRDDVIARGPFGIRTWFYDRRGTGGWESYLPPPKTPTDTYPQFSGGQAAAFAELNKQAKDRNLLLGRDSARAVWTDEDAPAAFDLENLRTGIIGFAGCSGSNRDSPPCTPPAGSSGFSADDWTAVVQEILAEISLAQQVVTHFGDLDDLRRDTFIAQGSALPAIGDQLKLAGAAGNQTDFDPKEMFSAVLEIVGGIASEGPLKPWGMALEVAGSVLSALPSASPTLTSEFDTTYSGLETKFASAVQEVDKAQAAQSQEVRQNYPLLALLAQLRSRGTWALDKVGLKSAANEGFALWAYKKLLPTIYARYAITKCVDVSNGTCRGPGAGPGVIGGGANFTALEPPPHGGFSPAPCSSYPVRGHGSVWNCDYTATPPADLATTVFAPVSPTCAYQPGNSHTAWTFGCNLGVNEQNSVSLSGGPTNGWNFSSYCGDPFVSGGPSTCASGRATVGRRGRLRLSGRTILPPRLRLDRVRVVAERLLYERGRRGELVRGPSGRALGPVRMSRPGPGGVLKDRPGGPRVRLRLRRLSGRRVAYVLRARRLRVRVPAACHALPASDALATPHVRLHLRLRLGDGHRRRTVSLPLLWRCVRARHGAITTLRTVRPKRLPARRGLRVSLRGPRTVRPGTSATYRVRVRNRRIRPRDRLRSSLWHVIVRGTGFSLVSRHSRAISRPQRITRRIQELRRGRSKTFGMRVRIPGAARGRSCVAAVASADAARPARARLCARVARR